MKSMILTALAALGSLAPMFQARAAQPDSRVYQEVEQSRAAALDLLRELVDIDSGTGDTEGGKRVLAVLEPKLIALGAEVHHESAESAELPDNLVATVHGSGRARILIIAHIDTVFGPGTAARRPFRIEGSRALGPGVGDEKGGIVTALTALSILKHMGFEQYASITLLLDDSEERGSPGSSHLIRSLSRASDVELNMEPGDPPDALTVWRKGSANIVLTVRGRAAHAGIAPQNGRNAAVELVHQLGMLESLLPHVGDGTTVNLTLLAAGERPNIIPDHAEATLNVRFRRPEDFTSVLNRIQALARATVVPDTLVSVSSERAYPPLIENPSIDALAHRAQAIYRELDRSLALSGNGGASESALAMAEGTPALDGLGIVGGDFHSEQEWIDLDSVVPRIYLLSRLLMDLATAPPPARAP
ncbi:MAG TPA: glutamate carboxypeptidase [Steroidobacteraceae bacterium]|nr:glutamate carboxypeptidase [Steroidobacteraceae bacterium]